MAVALPELPYARDALAPHMSEETLNFHYGKHHQAYVDNTNKLIDGGPMANASLEEIIHEANGKDQGLFNNAAQIWNHTFYWNSMKPNGGGAPTGAIQSAIDDNFGGYDAFKDAFAKAGATQFGSGWAWLVAKGGKLEVRKTANADLPLTEDGVTPLLTMDVWEHAYYLDHQNKRPAYIETFLDKLVNWDFANENLARA
ncbi:MAG: superoxide dismutase [Parvularculaceae bacterium]